MKKLQNPMPTLKVAQKLCENYGRSLNNHILLFNPVAPLVTSNGIMLSEAAQKAAQLEVNRKGMLVVRSGDGIKPETPTDTNKIYEGEIVIFNPQSPIAFAHTIKSRELLEGLTLDKNTIPRPDMYKTYVVLCMHKSSVAQVINKWE